MASPAAPMRAASAGAAVYLLLAGGAMLVRAGDWARNAPRAPFRWFNALLAVQLILNTLGNLASRSLAERYGMGAATVAGAALCGLALVESRQAP